MLPIEVCGPRAHTRPEPHYTRTARDKLRAARGPYFVDPRFLMNKKNDEY